MNLNFHFQISPLIFSFQRQFLLNIIVCTVSEYAYRDQVLDTSGISTSSCSDSTIQPLKLPFWGKKLHIYILVMNDPSLNYSDSFLGRLWNLQAVWVHCTKHDVKKSSHFHTSLHSTFHWFLKVQSICTWARQTACRIWWYQINTHFTTYRC